MSRRRRAEKREIIPDAKFGDVVVAKFMNSLMYDGKKSAAEADRLRRLRRHRKQDQGRPAAGLPQALRNVAPAVEVRSRRVGGATYQVPVEVRTDRRQALAIRWIITARAAATTRPWSAAFRPSCSTPPTIAALR
jgi:small subunit ribosomal protein S7